MTVPVADQRRLIHILADDLQPRIDWAYALEQTIALLGGGYLTAGNGDPNGLVTKPEGYLFLDLTTPAVWQNQNGGTVWTDISAGSGGGSTITVSAADPGATGAGSGWLLVDGSENPLAFFIRNTADAGWLSDGALPLGALASSVEIVEDLEVGVGGGVFARQIVTPLAVDGGFVTLFSSRFEGDAFPRLVVISDGSHYIGDGTTNPLQGNSNGFLPSGNGSRVMGNGSAIYLKDGTIELAPLNNEMTLPGLVHAAELIVGATDIPDGDLSAGKGGYYIDGTPGAPTVKFKVKDDNGDVFTATIPMTPA